MKNISFKTGLMRVRNLRARGVFARALAVYVVVALWVVGAVALFYSNSRSMLLSKEEEINRQYLRYVALMLDNHLTSLRTGLFSFLTSSHTSNSINSLATDVYTKYTLVGDLAEMKRSYSIAEDFYFYEEKSHAVLASGGSPKPGVLAEILGESYESILSGINGPAVYVHTEENSSVPVLTMMASSKNISSASYYIIAQISTAGITKLMKDQDVTNNGETFLIDGNGVVVAGSGRALGEVENALFTHLMQAAEFAPEGSFEFDDSLIVYKEASFMDGFYLTKIPMRTILANISGIKALILIVLCIVAAGIVVFILLFNNFFLTPIRRLFRMIPEHKASARQHPDEFAELSDYFSKVDMSEKHYRLIDLLQTGSGSDEFSDIFKFPIFTACIVIGENIQAYLKEAQEYFAETRGALIVKVLRGATNYIYLIINYENNMEGLPEDAHRFFFERFGLYSFIFVGETVLEAGLLKYSLSTAQMMMRQAVASDERYIFRYSEETGKTAVYYIPPEFRKELTQFLNTSHENKLAAYITAVFNKNSRATLLGLRLLFSEMMNYFILKALEKKLPIDAEHLLSYAEFELRPSKVMEFVTNAYSGLLAEETAVSSTPERVVKFVLSFIEENYASSDISVEIISEKIGFTPSYVSTLFKQGNGTSISDYLLSFRLDKSKALLSQAGMSVKEIALKVGFLNDNSFIRAFKREMGITPGEYRSISKDSKA